MPKIVLVVRELGRTKPEYSLEFELPEIPKAGDYISISRPDVPEPFSEDVVVRKVWWRLFHPETGGTSSDPQKVGRLTEVMVECDQAIGPYALDRWRDSLEAARERGIEVEEFDVQRFSVRQSDLSDKGN